MELNDTIKANCTNCVYVQYFHTDAVRFERCSVFYKKDKFKSIPINRQAMDSVLNGNPNLCERYKKSMEIDKEVVYE